MSDLFSREGPLGHEAAWATLIHGGMCLISRACILPVSVDPCTLGIYVS